MDTLDTSKMIFVFGSNTAGIHGAGAADFALRQRGALWGKSYGHYGQSFAIPTKGHTTARLLNSNRVGDTLPLRMIQRYVEGFLAYATYHPELQFQVTCIGCGLAGLQHHQVAAIFTGFEHENMFFDEKWRPYLQKHAQFWGEG